MHPKKHNNDMKKYLLFISAALLLGMTSCKKEQFDQELYNQYVDYEFMVDYMDKGHDWNLVKSDTVTITTGSEVQKVQILTANNFETDDAEIAAEGVCHEGETTLAYTLPLYQDQAYVVALASDGSYLGYRPLDYGTKTLDMTNYISQGRSAAREPKAQTFTYLYEASFPEPGDFDYNDVVMRVTKSYGLASYVVLLTVKLEAVGIRKQVAAGIHLGGVKYDDIYKVELVSRQKLDNDYPMPRRYIQSNDHLMRGRNGEAVINVLEDAHWAMLKNRASDGSITRMELNTSHDLTPGVAEQAEPVTVTYQISFKSPEQARCLTFDRIDPFIVEEYNGGLWEVHTYRYKFNDVLYNIFRGNQNAYDNHVSWCVTVPKGDFRYSIEGMPLGTYNKESGETFGPYLDFAHWMQSHKRYTTWYVTANNPQLLY